MSSVIHAWPTGRAAAADNALWQFINLPAGSLLGDQ